MTSWKCPWGVKSWHCSQRNKGLASAPVIRTIKRGDGKRKSQSGVTLFLWFCRASHFMTWKKRRAEEDESLDSVSSGHCSEGRLPLEKMCSLTVYLQTGLTQCSVWISFSLWFLLCLVKHESLSFISFAIISLASVILSCVQETRGRKQDDISLGNLISTKGIQKEKRKTTKIVVLSKNTSKWGTEKKRNKGWKKRSSEDASKDTCVSGCHVEGEK